ncbi:MAG: FtsX-like permease family protein, partial [Nocardioidaceae bacterium]
VGIAVALASAEGRADAATMTAVGAGPWRRRALGAMHGVFLGVVGALLGVAVGVPAGASLMQVDGLPGVALPWVAVAATLAAVPLMAGAAGWVVTPRRVPLVRRAE